MNLERSGPARNARGVCLTYHKSPRGGEQAASPSGALALSEAQSPRRAPRRAPRPPPPRPARAHRPRRLGPQPHEHQSREGQGRGGDKRWRKGLNGRDAPLASHRKPPLQPELGPRRYLLAMALPGSTMGTAEPSRWAPRGAGQSGASGGGTLSPDAPPLAPPRPRAFCLGSKVVVFLLLLSRFSCVRLCATP